MFHRHLKTSANYSAAAIDDIIGRGGRSDWMELCAVADKDRSVLEKILRVCETKVADPYEQRYHLWKYHAEHALT